jgi:succinyl-CoA synthetase beta subunit
MKVHEHDARRIFAQHGIPVPPSRVVDRPVAAKEAATEFGGQVVVKAQVLVGGRGKAGGVKLAATPDKARAAAADILGMDIRGETVHKVLIAPAVDIEREIYLGTVLDRADGTVRVMASAEGGVEIEEVAATKPEAIHSVPADAIAGIDDWQARSLGFELGLDGSQVRQFAAIARGLVLSFLATDASLAEINPLVVDGEGQLQAIDAKLNLDDSALYRHPDLAALRDPAEESPAEARARESGLTYVKLDGSIGCMVNGAGLAMATMDVIKHYGGEPANFLDVGGGAGPERIATAFEIILEDSNVRAVFINIFGGITRADDVARGVLEARPSLPPGIPLVVRLVGTNEEEGLHLLAQAGIHAVRSMDEAAMRAVEASA